MVRSFMISLLISIGGMAFSQIPVLPDSIQQKLTGKPDSTKAALLYTIGSDKVQAMPYDAQKLLQASLYYFGRTANEYGQAIVLNDLGACYNQQESYDQALEVLLKAEKIIKLINADSLLIDTYNNLGIVYERTNKRKDALRYYQAVRDMLLQEKASPLELARNLTNIAHVYADDGDRVKAIKLYEEALKLCEQHEISFGIGLLNQNLSNEYLILGKHIQALFHADRAIEQAIKGGYPRILVGGYENKGAVYLEQKRYTDALPFFRKAYASARQINYTKSIISVGEALAMCFEALGRLDSALYYQKSFRSFRDSIFTTEKNEKLTQLQVAYETEQKEATIQQLEQEKKLEQLAGQRKNILLIAIVGILGLAIAGVWLFMKRREAVKERQILQQQLTAAEEKRLLEQQKNDSELNALKAQMNPHFIFNALNSIQEMFLLGDKKLANEHLGRFSDLTRAILDSSGKKQISLQDELNILRDYLSLEQLRFEGEMEYQIEVAPDVNPTRSFIPPMIIQPYVENAFKHGLLHKQGAKMVKLIFRQDADILKVVVEDNGVGREKAMYYASMRPKKHQSFSTSATARRLALLNEGRTDKIGVVMEDIQPNNHSETGTRVIISIPIQKDY